MAHVKLAEVIIQEPTIVIGQVQFVLGIQEVVTLLYIKEIAGEASYSQVGQLDGRQVGRIEMNKFKKLMIVLLLPNGAFAMAVWTSAYRRAPLRSAITGHPLLRASYNPIRLPFSNYECGIH